MKKNEHIALAVLGIMAAGFGVSLPWVHTFAGGLCASASLAGLIGGLADWFAVSAIFTKPLGISFKTDMIVRNRDRLAKGVGKMVGEELLSPQSVEGFLAKRDLATMAVLLFDRIDGRRYLRRFLTQALEHILTALDDKAIARVCTDALRTVLMTRCWQGRLCEAIESAADSGKLTQAGQVLLCQVRQAVESDEMIAILEETASKVLAAYECDSPGRRFVHSMIDLSPARCAKMVQGAILVRLQEEAQAERGGYWLGRGLCLALDSIDEERIEEGIGQAELLVQKWLSDTREAVRVAPESVVWLETLARYAENAIDDLILDREKNESFNRFARARIGQFLSVHQTSLSLLAMRGVERLSDRELTGFLKAKVGHDLQMIRVNGSLVGAAVGAGLYLVRYLCKAVMI